MSQPRSIDLDSPRVGGPEATIGALVATATKDLSLLVRTEIELAKAELTATAKGAGVGAGMLVGGAVFGLFGVIMVLFTAAEAISLGVPRWAGFGIVALVLLVLAGLLAGLGGTRLKKVKGPQRTVTTVKDDLAWLKNPRQAPTTRLPG